MSHGQSQPTVDETPAMGSANAGWAWAPYQPSAENPWDSRKAGHLYRRLAFGASWEQLQQAVSDGPQATIDKLLHPKADLAAFNRAHDEYERAAAESNAAHGPQAWWLRRMIETPCPLLEQMTLFWHSYFALSNARINQPALMSRYLRVLRQHALGSFRALLEGVVGEPALFLCLGARANRKSRPNEGLARALLERYTVGPDRFSQGDVRGIARAFTGWYVSQSQLCFAEREHDSGSKQILGAEGEFSAKDTIALLLRQPPTAELVVHRLYRWFISETAPAPGTLVAPLAADFAQDYDISRVLEKMVRSNLFFSPSVYRQKVKSPVDFALGIIRPLGGTVGTVRLAADLRDLGQNLYEPPTGKGWGGSRFWINRYTLLGRARLAQELLAGSGPYEGKLDVARLAPNNLQRTTEDTVRLWCDLFLQGDVDGTTLQSLEKSARRFSAGFGNSSDASRLLAGLVVALPEFQLA